MCGYINFSQRGVILVPKSKDQPYRPVIVQQGRFKWVGKTRNITFQLVLQQCCKTRCKLHVLLFIVYLLFDQSDIK